MNKNHSAQPRWIRVVVPLAAALAASLGVLGLVGWVRGSDLLKSLYQPVAMSPVSAVCHIAIAIGLWLSRRPNSAPASRWAARILAVAVVTIAGLKLLSIATSIDVNFDTWLFPTKLAGNRIAPNTAFGILLLGMALLTINFKNKRGWAASPIFAGLAALLATLAIVGYGYSIPTLFVIGRFVPMALNTAFAFLILSVGMFCARPQVFPASAILRNWSHEKVMVAGFTVAMMMLCLIGGVAYHSTAKVIAGNVLDVDSLANLEIVSELTTVLADAETGQRGYLLTGEEPYLAPYTDALRRVESLLTDLRGRETALAEQLKTRQTIETLVHAKFAELQRTIDLRRDQGLDAAMKAVKTGEGKEYMDELRKILPRWAREERVMLAQRNLGETQTGQRTLRTIAVGTIITFLIVVLAATLVRVGTKAQKRAQHALHESELRFRQLADTVDAVFWLVSADGSEQLYLSPRYEQIWGRTVQSLYENPLSWLKTIEPEDRERVRIAFAAAANTGKFEADYRIRRTDGQVRHIQARGFGIRDQNDKIYRLAGIAEDSTARKMAEEQLERATQAAEAASRAKSAFLANMSHEIRTPMTAILGYADMLLAPKQSPSDRLDCIHTIRRQSQHLLSVLNDILDISKIEAGKLDVELIECDPFRILSESISLMRVRAIEKKLQLGVTYAGPVPATIKTDPTRLRQILINLIGNAIKFTDKGGVQVVVSLENDPNSSPRLRLEVIDSGIGMAAVESAALFQPFSQADSSTTRRFGGTGLGLSICKRLAQMLGGDITLQSRPGCGSRFTVTVETGNLDNVALIFKTHEAVSESTTDQGAAVKEETNLPLLSGTILLAEDGAHNQRVISYYLEMAGARVEVAENGWIACEKAMEAAARRPFDLILMDMQMPELDGYSAAAILRSKGYAGPIVALTAHAMSGDRAKCISAGCTDYLTKPVEKGRLIELAAKYLPAPPPDDSGTPTATQKIDSDEVANDPAISHLLSAFIADLPSQVQQLLKGLAEQDIAHLQKLVHQLSGCGGMYGFPEMTELAAQAEDKLIESQAIAQATEDVLALVELIRGVKGYDCGNEGNLVEGRINVAHSPR
jgi:hypothetical protein